MGVERLQAETGVPVRWLPFPLHPDTPQEGRSLHHLFAGTGMDVDAMLHRLRRVAADLDLPWGDRTHTYNSRLAQELGVWAESLGAGDAYRNAVYRAYFVDGVNIGEAERLLGVVGKLGLPTEQARAALAESRYAAAVDASWAQARRLGISAVPTHLYRGRALSGLRPYSELLHLLHSAT